MAEHMPDLMGEDFALSILRRAPLAISGQGEAVRGRRVLVTGAAGSIGNALVQLLAGLPLAHLTLVDSSESGLVLAGRRLALAAPELPHSLAYCDIRDRAAVLAVHRREQPDIVFHAAALKHLPLLEAHPREGALTNILGTRNVIDAARACGAGKLLLVSTDKAVNPATVLGSTKRIAEALCQTRDGQEMRCVPVRLCNVFGSSGSVVQVFHDQLVAGEPLTLTDPMMTRYFMTGGEAARVLVAAVPVAGVDALPLGSILAPDVGPPHTIGEIAERLAEACGKSARPIRVIGMRAGEQLAEAWCYPHERRTRTDLPGLYRLAGPLPDPLACREAIEAIERACATDDRNALAAGIAQVLALLGAPAMERGTGTFGIGVR